MKKKVEGNLLIDFLSRICKENWCRVFMLTFLGLHWWDLWLHTDAVDPVSYHAFRDNKPNDLVRPMPISVRPDDIEFSTKKNERRRRREKKSGKVIKKIDKKFFRRMKDPFAYSYIKLIIHLILWIILLWLTHKNRVNWIKWEACIEFIRSYRAIWDE